MEQLSNYSQEHKDQLLNELFELLRIPSVSADSAFNQEVAKTAEAVKQSLEKAGCDNVTSPPNCWSSHCIR